MEQVVTTAMSYGYSARLIKLNKQADSKLIGVRLGRMCIRHDVPVSVVASTLGVSRQTVYNWFAGGSIPQTVFMERIKRLLASLNSK